MNASLFEAEVPSYAAAVFPPPRPFQAVTHEALRDAVKDGHKNLFVMAPTGAGKLYVAFRIAYEALSKGKKVVFVCDRKTLINQASETADKYGLKDHSIIQARHWRYNEDCPFQIATAQSLENTGWPDADVIIIDEAHTLRKTWTDHIQSTRAVVVGLSATPFSAGLGKLFSKLICAATMHDLTQSGVLVPMRVLSCTKIDMKGAATSNGEWAVSAAGERGNQIIGDVVAEWARHAEGRKTIIFGSTIAFCEDLCRQFNEAGLGVMAATFTKDTEGAERDSLVADFRQPNHPLRILISVEALAKGFDVPDVGCVVDCRPLRKSLSTAIQMWGRGLRSSPETGKTDCLLLDHSGNIIRFMEDYSDIYYNGLDALDTGEKMDKAIRHDVEEKELKGCPACGAKPFYKRCVACGYERPPVSVVEVLPGEMQPVMIGKKKLADNEFHLWQQVCSYAKSHGKPETQSGRAYHLFKDITGKYPERDWNFALTKIVEVSANVASKIQSRNIAFAKSKAKCA